MRVAGVAQKLNAQINREFYSSNLYLQLSEWCAAHRFNSSALFLRHQAQGNVTQMMRVFDFMKHAGAMPVVRMSETPNSACTSLEEIYIQTLQDCQLRLKTLSRLAHEAENADDLETLTFLRELEEMQQEVGLMVIKLLVEVRKANEAGLGMEQTDKSLLPIFTPNLH